MAVELTKVALWIETVSPASRWLLDANICCGDPVGGSTGRCWSRHSDAA
jgi:hypothetical protein